MYIALLLSFSLLSSSAPLSGPGIGNDNNPLELFGRQVPECVNPGRHRTLQEIVLSCLSTIIACTWVTVHPNVPGIWDSTWEKTKRKLIIMTYAVLAPEFMAFWALRQWIAAGRIAKEFNNLKLMDTTDKDLVPKSGLWAKVRRRKEKFFKGRQRILPTKWTRTHGFFVQMGGFMLYKERQPTRVLDFAELKRLIKAGEVKVPDITEDEINNMSKGDVFSKLVAVLQTTWFAIQCFTRWGYHLPVTELEVVTLAFAALSVVTYTLWWKKPQKVLVAVRVQSEGNKIPEPNRVQSEGSNTPEPNRVDPMETKELPRGGEEKEKWLKKILRVDMKSGWSGLFGVPLALILGLVRPLLKMSEDDETLGKMKGTKLRLRVPMFSTDNPNQARDLLPISLVGMIFGGIHLVPWPSPFPSTVELWLWRSSALLITIEPLTLFLFFFANRADDHYYSPLSGFFWEMVFWVASLGAPLYLLARLILLSIAFTTLRALPQDAYTAIEWTTFIPHF